jgi:hypothetical protein
VIAKKLGLRAVEVPVRWANVEGFEILHRPLTNSEGPPSLRFSHLPPPQPTTSLQSLPANDPASGRTSPS